MGYVVGFGVGWAMCEGFGGDVEGGDVGLGEVDGEGDGDGSRAGAYVGDAERVVVGETVEDGFDEVLGLGAGDEDGGGDVEGEAVELLLAGDVLDGFVGEAAVDGCVRRRLSWSGVSSSSGWARRCAREIARVWRRRSSASRGAWARRSVAELLGCGGEGLAEGCGCLWLLVVLFSGLLHGYPPPPRILRKILRNKRLRSGPDVQSPDSIEGSSAKYSKRTG